MRLMKDNSTIFLQSILGGICIGLGGAIFLKLGGIVGAIMFAFGLLTIIHFRLPLYTGIAGFINMKILLDYQTLLIVLIGNIIGCWLLSLLNIQGIDGSQIIQSRIDVGYLQCFLNAIGCGIIMTLIVKGGRDKNLLLILFGIPLFILLGFYHSIADAFYACVSNIKLIQSYFLYYIIIIVGNFVGCNIPRIFKYI